MRDFDRDEFEDRWKRIRAQMRVASLDAIIVTTASNYRYLCGHRSVQFALGRRPMMLILGVESAPTLLLCNAEVRDALAQTWVEDVRGYAGLQVKPEMVVATLRDLDLERARLGFELGPLQRLGLSQWLFDSIRENLPAALIADGSGVLETARMVKSTQEIARIEAACRLVSQAQELLPARVHVGLSVQDCHELAVRTMIEIGADADATPIASFGSYPRGHIFGKGDLFQVDLALAYRGYRADMTRRFIFGPASDDLGRDHEQITELQTGVLDAIRPGVTAQSVIRRYNEQVTAMGHPPLPASEWIGHGIGMDLLERPSLDAMDETRMLPGMVLTPEPWFLRGGMFVMTEETILVTETGNRVLTQPVQAELGSVAR